MKKYEAEWVPTFDKWAAAPLLLHQAVVVRWWWWWQWWWWWRLWEHPQWVQLVYVVHGALIERFRVVDGADDPGQRRRGPTEATVHPGAMTHTFQLHLSGQVAVSAVVQALHAVGHLSGVWIRGEADQCRQLLSTCKRDFYMERMTSEEGGAHVAHKRFWCWWELICHFEPFSNSFKF